MRLNKLIWVLAIFLFIYNVYAAEGDFVTSWNLSSNNTAPWGVEYNETYLWIVNTAIGNEKVHSYTTDGTYRGISWATTNTAPRDLCSNGTDTWVVDYNTNDIYHYTSNGTFNDSWDVGFAGPIGCATDNLNIYVSSLNEGSQIYKYTMNGTSISNFDTGTAGMTAIRGITTDGSFIWAIDTDDALVYKFDMSGNFILTWALAVTNTGAQDLGVSNDGARFWATNGSSPAVYEYSGTATFSTPPRVIDANMTSDGVNERINLSDRFCMGVGCVLPTTTDKTPTFVVTLNQSGNITVINNNRNLNYSDIFKGTTNSAGTSITLTITLNDSNSSSVGLRNFSLSAVDRNNGTQNLSATLFFTVNITDAEPPNVTIFRPLNGTVFGQDTNLSLPLQFNFTARDNIDRNISNCSLFIDSTLRFNKTFYNNGTLFLANITYNTTGTHYWSVNCTDTSNNKNGSNVLYFVMDFFNELSINVSVTGGVNFTFKPFVEKVRAIHKNQSVTYIANNTNIALNKTNIISGTEKLYNNGTIVNQGNTSSVANYTFDYTLGYLRILDQTSLEWIVGKINISYEYYTGSFAVRTQNISCSGQNETLGCLTASNTGTNRLNFSLLWNLTINPQNQKLIEDFTSSINWTPQVLRRNNTFNTSLANHSVLCLDLVSANSTGQVRYRFNNTYVLSYLNASNGSVSLNFTFDCPNLNAVTRILNATQTNISKFDTFNFSWRGDNSSNKFNISVISSSGAKATSVTLNLLNLNWNTTGFSLGTLADITQINISVINDSGTAGLNNFFLDNLKIMNSSTNQSDLIKMYASCTKFYQNATRLLPFTLTNICQLSKNSTNYIWLFQDINLSLKGLSWKLQYNASMIS